MLDAQTLMRQSVETAETYLDRAIILIDKRLGPGYAAAHPELVGAFMQTAALDFLSTFASQVIAESVEKLADARDA